MTHLSNLISPPQQIQRTEENTNRGSVFLYAVFLKEARIWDGKTKRKENKQKAEGGKDKLALMRQPLNWQTGSSSVPEVGGVNSEYLLA